MHIIAEVEAICRRAEREQGRNWTVADLSDEDKEILKEASHAEFMVACDSLLNTINRKNPA